MSDHAVLPPPTDDELLLAFAEYRFALAIDHYRDRCGLWDAYGPPTEVVRAFFEMEWETRYASK